LTDQRTVEDRLREEYFLLLPEIRRVAARLEAEIKYSLLSLSLSLASHERLLVTSRVKDCESAIEKLKREEEAATFDQSRPEIYTLTSLKDLAGVRVLAFPPSRLIEANQALRSHKEFASWKENPFQEGAKAGPLAFKYFGKFEMSDTVQGEFQVVSMLTGLFWDVEHAALYKPSPELRGLARSPKIQQRSWDVLKALKAFEEEFEELVRHDPLRSI
jgi:ppGpp synthetase/RelA/SpoT-type nucleotidyltranferase